jgi:hypothetical protein
VRKVINIILIMALFALILGMLLAIGVNTDAQERRRSSGGIDISLSNEDVPRLFEIIRIWKIVEELELDDQQLQKFLPRFNELNDLRGKYYRQRHEASIEMKKLLEANTPDSKLKSALDKYRDMEVEFHQKERQLEDALNSGLSIKQQIKFIAFEYEYRRDMNRLMRNLRELSEMKEQQKPHQPVPVQQKKD